MKRLLLLPLLLAAACDHPDLEEIPPPQELRPLDPPPAAPAGGGAAAGYVGRWAAAPELCATGAWVFTADRLVTAGEVACDFSQVSATGDAWAVQATCTAEASPQPATLRLTRAAGGGLRVEGGPFEPVTLKLCAENWAQPTKP